MAASLTPPLRSVAELKAAESGYKQFVAAAEHLLGCEDVLQKKLEEAQRQSQAREAAIDHVFKTQSHPSEALVKNLNSQNAQAFFIEGAMKACDEEFQRDTHRIDNLFHRLSAIRQQNHLLLLQNQLDNRILTIKQGTPFQLQRMANKLAWIVQDLEQYPAKPHLAAEYTQQLWKSDFAAVKNQQETFWDKEPPATLIGKFLEELDLFAINPPHDGLIASGGEPLLQRYREQYKELKKTCVGLWNKSLQHRIQIEMKFAFIASSQELKVSLPELQEKFAQLERDLETLRHQFKGKNQSDPKLTGSRVHLSKKFEELKTTFFTLLLIWKNVQPKCHANFNGLVAKAGELKEIATHAIEDASSFNRLLTEDVPGWLALFQNAPTKIKAHLEEIALWMDITSAMISNPSWVKFPQRGAFKANLQNLYTNFTTFRDAIK